MSRIRFHHYAWGLLAYNLPVVVFGAYVRATKSGDGCGAHWPTCGGNAIPQEAATKTIVEYSHRLSSLLSLLLIVGLVVWARRAFPKGHTARLGAGLALFSVVVSSLIGAGLVLYRLVAGDTSMTRAVVMSAHLVNTLFLFAALALTALWGNGMPRLQLRGQGRLGTLFVASVIGMVALGVTGALSALGDTLYPASSLAEGIRQDFHPDASYLLQHRPLHPLTAMIVATLLIVTSLSAMARRASPGTQFWGRSAISFVIAQLIVGFTNLILLAPIWMQLLHLLVANLLWISFVMLGAHALKSQEEVVPQRAQSRDKAGGKWPLKSPSLP